MKIFTLTALCCSTLFLGICQSTKPTNVYPSNLEENMYFKGFDANQNAITGLHFLVLSDGDNSRDKTPAFEVSIYLMPEGKSSREDLIIIKKYQLDGIYHMGSHEFKNETISLAGINVPPGNYRLGIWVNSNGAFEEDKNDNATLFNNTIRITAATGNNESPANETPANTEEEGWGNWNWEEEED